MSGICGVWHKQYPQRLGQTLKAVTTQLALSPLETPAQVLGEAAGVAVQARFPDSQQVFRNDRVLLACDADLLNMRELAAAAGQRLEETTAAAVMAALYEERGDSFLDAIDGAFAIILWDITKRRLLAAIDRFGIKRLAWYANETQVVVASRVDAVHAATSGLDVNPRAIANVINFTSDLAPETIFTGVRRLEPATMLHANGGETRTASYWDMRYEVDGRTGEKALAEQLRSVMERSVSAHCRGETPGDCGAFLSGGTDSSTIVGLMSRALGPGVKAFSIGFQEERFNELRYADIAARSFGADHRKYFVSARDCFDALPHVVRAFDEPFGNSSAVATYFCTKLAADHGVRTLLAGDGGDELFGGNERYATERVFTLYHDIPAWLRRGIVEPAANLPINVSLARKVRGYIRRANLPDAERMFSYHFLRDHAVDEVFSDDFLESLDGYDVLTVSNAHYARAPAADHLNRLLYVDVKITLGDNDLPKVTCASELAGVRTRFPFLGREVAEFSGRIPAALKLKRFEKRYLFKQAFAQLLPAEIIRKKKHGFGIPVAFWIKSDPLLRELASDTLFSSRAQQRGYYRPGFVQDLFRKHDETNGTYYGDIIWAILMLELWHTVFVDRRTVQEIV
jgi:asparagine synthase (glutamine-hydrolysing)